MKPIEMKIIKSTFNNFKRLTSILKVSIIFNNISLIPKEKIHFNNGHNLIIFGIMIMILHYIFVKAQLFGK